MEEQFNPGPTHMQEFPAEWLRPAREWLPSDLLADALKANERTDAAPAGTPVLPLWPVYVVPTPDGPQAMAIGFCTHCGRVHGEYGVSRNPVRHLHCSGGDQNANQPGEGLVRFILDECLPEDLAYEMKAHRPDLLTLSAILVSHIRHHMLRRATRRKPVTGAPYRLPGPWKREHAHLAFRRIVDCHVLDTHIASLIYSERTVLEAERIAVARFIRSCEGSDMAHRLRAAILLAHKAAGRGEIGA